MPAYDPKLLEAFYRFMAEASRSQGQAQDFFEALGQATSPEAWARPTKPVAASSESASEANASQLWESYWEALGFVPRRRYDELERHYQALKEKLEEAERLLKQEKTGEAVAAWSKALEQTLQAQQAWWASWLDNADKPDPD